MKRSTARTPVALTVPHAARDLRLQVEGQAVFRPAGEVVKVTAHRPQERRERRKRTSDWRVSSP